MTDKLVWDYDQSSGEHHAIVKRNSQTYRIRAVLDSTPQNPFTDGDCNWPIVVRSPDAFSGLTSYLFGEQTTCAERRLDMDMFTDAALVHNQIHIAKVLDFSIAAWVDDQGDLEPAKYLHDADILRAALTAAIEDVAESKLLEAHEELYKIAGWPAYRTTVTGYCQGDWAEVLVVATPEAQAKFRPEMLTMPADEALKLVFGDLENTAKLYGWWAWGDVYGYIVEQRAAPTFELLAARQDVEEIELIEGDRYRCEDDVGDTLEGTLAEIEDWLDCGTDDNNGTWEELPDGSCWGYYGPDHHESGLEDSALGCIPDEMKEAA